MTTATAAATTSAGHRPDITLRATGIAKRFRGVVALDHVDLEVRRGTIHGVVGPNGAGKSTLLNILTGFVPATAGQVEFDGQNITGWSPQRRVSSGMVRTFQNLRLFGGLTVRDNVRMGQHVRAVSGYASLWPRPTAKERDLQNEADRALAQFGLENDRNRPAADLPYGQQKQLELARALGSQPRLMLLDEPAAGMTAEERRELVPRLKALRDDDRTVVLVEHDMELISAVCDTVTVLNFGAKLMEGPPEVALASDAVRVAYLGD